MGGLELTPRAKKRLAKKRRTEEAAWRAKAGPVKSYFVDPGTLQDAASGVDPQ
jgi:hypothetical protein